MAASEPVSRQRSAGLCVRLAGGALSGAATGDALWRVLGNALPPHSTGAETSDTSVYRCFRIGGSFAGAEGGVILGYDATAGSPRTRTLVLA
jgi:hypothetical protein